MLLMVLWRSFFNIVSSRYTAGFIFPFVFFSTIFICALFKNKAFLKLLGITTLIVISLNWINKNYINARNSSNLEAIAELHDRYNKRINNSVLVTGDNALRIGMMEKNNNPFMHFGNLNSLQSVNTFDKKYKRSGQIALLDILTSSKERVSMKNSNSSNNLRYVLSVFSQKNKKKRHHIFSVESKARVFTLSQNKALESESGLLENGDLELLDTPEESYRKLAGSIGNYDSFFKYNDSIRTPINAYFHNSGVYTQFLPYYNCSNENAISGNNSARITIKKGIGSILFYQKFYSGKYVLSAVFKGEKDSRISLLYDCYQDNKWNPITLTNYIIEDKSTKKVEIEFDASSLKPKTYFLVGASVFGDVYLDNFCIKKID